MAPWQSLNPDHDTHRTNQRQHVLTGSSGGRCGRRVSRALRGIQDWLRHFENNIGPGRSRVAGRRNLVVSFRDAALTCFRSAGSMQRASSVLGASCIARTCHQIITRPGQCLSNRKIFLRIFVLSRHPADSDSAFGNNGKPCLCLCRSHQFAVMLEDHLRAVARFQRHLCDVLDVRHAVADE